MPYKLVIFFLLLMTSGVYAQRTSGPQSSPAPLQVTDGITSCYPYSMSFSAGTVSCTNSIATITNSGGGGGSGSGTVTTGSIFQIPVYSGNSNVLVGSPIFYNDGTNIGIGTSGAFGGKLVVIGGNVGIGTITPGQVIDINGNARVTSTNSLFFGDRNLASINTDSAGTNSTLIFSTSNGAGGVLHEDARFNAVGNLGVGTTAPLTLVHVGPGILTPDSAGGTILYVSKNGATQIKVMDSTNNVSAVITAGPINTSFNTGSASPLFLGSAASKTLLPGGNVGINSTFPGTRLDVQGTARTTAFQLNQAPLAGGNVLVSDAVGVGTWMPASTLPITSGSGSPAGNTNAVQYNSSGSFAGNDSVFSFNGVNVGVGTTNGTNAILDIRGNIYSNGNIGLGTTSFASALGILGGVGIGTIIYSSNLSAAIPVGSLGVEGNVGIGTAIAADYLTIRTNTNSNSGIRIRNTNANNSAAGLILVQGNGSGVISIVGNGSSNNQTRFGLSNISQNTIYNSNSAFGFGTTTGHDTYFGTTDIRRMTVTAGGNVGIGTNVLLARLGVVGNIGIGTTIAGSPFLLNSPPNGGMIVEGNVGIGTWTANGALVIIGNIGIGSTAPQASIDLGSTGTIISHSTTGVGTSVKTVANQACNTTCGTSACWDGYDVGTLGVALGHKVACTDATADECTCVGP